MLHFLGLILVLASWLGGYYLFKKLYDKDLPTISRHAASNKTAYRIFAVILTGLGLSLFYWLTVWFAPHLQLTEAFKVVLTITIACLVVATVTPDTTGWRHNLHQVTAYTMAILYLPLSLLIIGSHELAMPIRLLCTALFLYMLVGIIVVALLHKDKTHYLFHQTSYVVLFQLIILSAAYL